LLLVLSRTDVNLDLLKVLERVESFKPTIETINRLESQIKYEQFPKDQEELNYISSRIQELNNTWNSLDAPPEVLIFLKAAASNTGCPLDLLSPTVYKWVREYHLDKKLRIRFN
jgi:hypothetical protein